MKRTTVSSSWATIGLLLACWSGNAAFSQDARIQLGDLERLAGKAAEVVDVTLDGTLLKLAARFLSNTDADREVKNLVEGLQGIYVKSFEFDKEGEYSDQDVEALRKQLKSPKWSRIVGVTSKRGGDNAEVYVMTDSGSGKVLGMSILCAEPKELTVVNIVGSIDLDKVAELGGKMGIPPLKLETLKKPEKKPEEQEYRQQ
jgi:hypothetical protein